MKTEKKSELRIEGWSSFTVTALVMSTVFS